MDNCRGKALILMVVLGWLVQPLAAQEEGNPIMEMVDRIHWFGQAAVMIETGGSGNNLFIDPYKLAEGSPAAVVLVTHCHQDHCSPDDLAKVVDEQTVLIAPADCMPKLTKLPAKQRLSLQAGEEGTFAGIKVEAVPAYNIKKTKYHPKENGWVGYIVTVDGVRIYHLGDTERIPEMQEISCDIALVPLGQTYTMSSVAEAAAAVRDTQASVAIPIHYGMYEGKPADAEQLKQMLTGEVEVVIQTRPSDP